MKRLTFVIDDKRNILFRVIRQNIIPLFNFKGIDMTDVDIIIEDTGFEMKSDGSDVKLQHRSIDGNKQTQMRINFSFSRNDGNPIPNRNYGVFTNDSIKIDEALFSYKVRFEVTMDTSSRTIVELFKDAMVDYMDRGFETITFNPSIFYSIPRDLENLLGNIATLKGLDLDSFLETDSDKLLVKGNDIENKNDGWFMSYEHIPVVITGDRLSDMNISSKDNRYSVTGSFEFELFLPIGLDTDFEIVVNNQLVDLDFIVDRDLYTDVLKGAQMIGGVLVSPKYDEVKYGMEGRDAVLSVLFTTDDETQPYTVPYFINLIEDNFNGIDRALLMTYKEPLLDFLEESIKATVEDGTYSDEAMVEYLTSVVNGPVIEYIMNITGADIVEAKYITYVGGFSIIEDIVSYNLNFILSLGLTDDNVDLLLKMLYGSRDGHIFIEYFMNRNSDVRSSVPVAKLLQENYDLTKPEYDLKAEIIYNEFIKNKDLTYIDKIFVSVRRDYLFNLKYIPDVDISVSFAGLVMEGGVELTTERDVEAVTAHIIINDKDVYCEAIIDRDLNVYSLRPTDPANTNRVLFSILENQEFAKPKDKELLKRWQLSTFDKENKELRSVQIVKLVVGEQDGDD